MDRDCKERIEKRGWSQTDLAIVVGVSPSAITQLLKDGKGSDDLKLRINKNCESMNHGRNLRE